jgi:hypothetical protein
LRIAALSLKHFREISPHQEAGKIQIHYASEHVKISVKLNNFKNNHHEMGFIHGLFENLIKSK